MFSDKSLLPKEAIRLAALGLVAENAQSYSEIANGVRHFTSRIVGPSLDLLGSSIEILKTEGLIAAAGPGEDADLMITDAGRAELGALLRTAVRAPTGDLGRLSFALKMRFLHHLDIEDQRTLTEVMIEACDAEIARLADLESSDNAKAGVFAHWLSHDIGLARSRRDWLTDLRASL